MTTLWDKFQAAVRYVRTTVAAAVASIRVAPTMTPFKLLDGVSADNSAPTLSTDGADVAGWAILKKRLSPAIGAVRTPTQNGQGESAYSRPKPGRGT